MTDNGLQNYIRERLAEGKNIEETTSLLLKKGFDAESIHQGFLALSGNKLSREEEIARNNFLPPLSKKKEEIGIQKSESQKKAETKPKAMIIAGGSIFKGRIGRTNYSLGILLTAIIIIAGGVLLGVIFDLYFPSRNFFLPLVIFLALSFPVFLFGFSLHVRRLHDLGFSGLVSLIYLALLLGTINYFFLVFFSLISIILFLYLLVKKGEVGINKYGRKFRRRSFRESFFNFESKEI